MFLRASPARIDRTSGVFADPLINFLSFRSLLSSPCDRTAPFPLSLSCGHRSPQQLLMSTDTLVSGRRLLGTMGDKERVWCAYGVEEAAVTSPLISCLEHETRLRD